MVAAASLSSLQYRYPAYPQTFFPFIFIREAV